MTPARWQKVKETLASAMERETTTERGQFLSSVCADDTALRREVESLLGQSAGALDAWADSGGFIGGEAAPSPNEGRRIGPYQLVQELGRGGMGTVWLAQRADAEFKKTVAIKLLKRGTDTDEVLRRFRAERQILAPLDHPNIARLLDGGTTADGLPYFVMEYVDGIRLTDFVTQRQLSLGARLDLFARIGGAVQFAHQNLIVHRDLKPANILVTAEGEPKLLDFGIAKLLAASADDWQATIAGRERLTPAYAAPEQVRGEPITTVSDIYSLGALLYEMLCQRPAHRFEKERPTEAELERVICRDEPVRPALAAVEPEMRRALRGDLETVVLRAMAKAPARRYTSVDQFLGDVRRYRQGRPVRARKDTVAYRTSKFVQRNKLGVAVAAFIALTLLGGIIATTLQRNRAELLLVRAEKSESAQRRLLYDAQMSLAYQAWEGGNSVRALALLEAQESSPKTQDLRGFEWPLLWQLVHERSRLLPGSTGRMREVVFSRDGSLIAARNSQGRVFLWERASGRALRSFEAGPALAKSLAFSPDGKFLFTGDNTGVARQWPVAGGAAVRTFSGQQRAIHALALSPDGQTLATAGQDYTVNLWSVAQPTAPVILAGHSDVVNSLAFSPDGSTLASASRDHTARLWQVATGQEIATLTGHTWWVLDVCFSSNGKTLATSGSDGDIRLWNVATAHEAGIIRGDGNYISSVAFSPNDQFLAAGAAANGIKIYQVATGKLADTLRGNSGPALAVTFSPDAKSLAAVSDDPSVRLWDLNQRGTARTFAGHTDWIWEIAISPDSRTLATASKDATVKLWDIATGRNLLTLAHAQWVNGVSFSSDGERLLTGSDDAIVRLWDRKTGRLLRAFPPQESVVECVRFSPDGRLLAAGTKHGEIRLWDAQTGAELATLHANATNLVWALAFSPNGKQLAAAEGGMDEVPPTTGHFVTVWEIATRRRVANLASHTSDVRALAYSPDGRRLASGSWDGTIKFWDAATFAELFTLKSGAVQALEFSPDGERLASAGLDKTVKLWDVTARQELCTLTEPGEINSLAFSRDGHVLAVGGNDGLAHIWSVDSFRVAR